MGPGDQVDPALGGARAHARRVGGVARLGGDHDRVRRNGAPAVTVANFCENSPKLRCSARSRTRPKAAASQKAVAPPLPSATS